MAPRRKRKTATVDIAQVSNLVIPKRRGRKPKAKPKPNGDDNIIYEIVNNIPTRRSRKVIQNDEQLQEERFKEELQKQCGYQAVLKLSRLHNQGSDEEDDLDVGAPLGLDEFEDEEDVAELNEVVYGDSETRCPRPAPRKGRGGHKFLKRNLDVEVSCDEVHEMRLIISSTMRKSLTSTNSVIVPENSDGEPEYSTEIYKRIKDIDNLENRSDPTIYRHLWRILEIQNQWLNAKTLAYKACPKSFAENLCSYHLKNGLSKQLCVEHLSWIAIVLRSVNSAERSVGGMLAWFPAFQRKYSRRYPGLENSGLPGSRTELDIFLKIATLKACAKLNDVLQEMYSARATLIQLIDLVEKVHYDKNHICDEFELIHDDLNIRAAKFDECSVWGLKPIRMALEPPYFKSEDGLLAAPLLTTNSITRNSEYFTCFFKRDKQKWTTKDLQQLKTCIKEALHTQKLSALRDRYEMLIESSICRYEDEMTKEGRFDAPPPENYKRKRGRPKKSELEITCKYGIINPVVGRKKKGGFIRSKMNAKSLAVWRTEEEKKLKSKTYEELVAMENERVDWASVANKMVLRSRKLRSPEDCELAWRHEVHPCVNDKRWGVEENKRLKSIYSKGPNVISRNEFDWQGITYELNILTSAANKPGRTMYQCFFRVRNRIDPPKKLDWSDITKNYDSQVLSKLEEHPGNWRVVAASIDDPAATKRQVIERFKKTINPVLKNGSFSRVEDCLLLLTIEKLKPFLAREGHFGCLLAYLPWRCETTWRDRANNLFSDWIVPWTLEEDKMLLELAVTMKRNWQKISEEFTSFKNRKGCLTRHKILVRRLKEKQFNKSLEAYHEAYAMTRYNVFQYKHLKEMLDLLKKVKANPLPKEHSTFVGLLRDRKPSDVRLQHMLLTFDKGILDSAIESLSRYVFTRDNYWRTWISKHGKRKRTFDRRTFHPENPQSVASALHIMRLELKEKESIQNLSDFEDEIYKYYARFRRTKALNVETERRYIPDARTLAKWSAVSRLIATPLHAIDDDKDEKKTNKWKWLVSDDDNDSLDSHNGHSKSKKLKSRRTTRARKTQTVTARRVGRPRTKR